MEQELNRTDRNVHIQFLYTSLRSRRPGAKIPQHVCFWDQTEVVIMPTKEDLEHMGTTQLAVLCGKVAESPTAGSVAADQAHDMKQEWALLVASATPRLAALEAQKDYEAKMERLRRKTVGFLAAVLPGSLALPLLRRE